MATGEELDRRLRERHEAEAWERAAADSEFHSEADRLEAAYDSADRETWSA